MARRTTIIRKAAQSADEKKLNIALRMFDWGEWSRQVIRGVRQYSLEHRNWRLYIVAAPPGNPRVLKPGMRWDGIITSVLADIGGYQKLLATQTTKVVSVTAAIPKRMGAIPSVRVDEDKVAEMIGRHFLAGGYRQIAWVGRPGQSVIDFRAIALRRFAQHAQCELHVNFRKDSMAGRNVSSITQWLKQLPKPVGLATWNINEARELADACVRLGIRVPEDIAIVAWDDDEMIAESQEPSLSAAVLPAERLGYEGAKLLDILLNGKPVPPMPILVEPQGILHVRQSSDVSALKDREVYLALQYIREKGLNPIRVIDVAQHLSISRRKLEQDFSRVTGQTIHDAMIQVRFDHAKMLLADTDWSIDRVAQDCGFQTAQSLHRLFRQKTNLTPGEYRTRVGM